MTFYIDKSKYKFVPIRPFKAYNFGGTAPLILNIAAWTLAKEPAAVF